MMPKYYLARKYSKEELGLLSDADVQSSPSSGYLQRHLSLPESALAASQSLDSPLIVDGVPKFASSTCVISSDYISLFVNDEQTVTAHFEDGSPYSWKVNPVAGQFTLACGEFASSMTPVAKVSVAPPTV